MLKLTAFFLLFGFHQSEPFSRNEALEYRELNRVIESWQVHYDKAKAAIDSGRPYPWTLETSKNQLKFYNRQKENFLNARNEEMFLEWFEDYSFRKFYGDSNFKRLPNRNTSPLYSSDSLTQVLSRDYPLDHFAISDDFQIYFDHYNNKPEFLTKMSVYDLLTRKEAAFPPANFQNNFSHIHSMRLDSRGRLWVLDAGTGYFVHPKLFIFDTFDGRLLYIYNFLSSEAGFGSMLNDFVIDEKRNLVYITDTSPLAGTPALLVLDLSEQSARRVLQNHVSVRAASTPTYLDYDGGKKWTVLGGLVAPKIAVDGIAFDPNSSTLYFAPGNGGRVYSVSADALADFSLPAAELEKAVDRVAETTMTDGMALDSKGRLYLSDREHSAIVRVDPKTHKSETIIQDPKNLQWISTLQINKLNELYISTMPLNELLFMNESEILNLNRKFPLYKIQLED